MSDQSPVSRDPEVCGGALVFAGHRVYVDSLFELLAAGLKLSEIVGPASDYYPSVSIEQAQETLRVAYRLLEAYPHGDPPPGNVVWCLVEESDERLLGVYSTHTAAEHMAAQRPEEWEVEDWLVLDEPLDVSGLEDEEYRDVLGIAGEIPDPRETEDEEEESP